MIRSVAFLRGLFNVLMTKYEIATVETEEMKKDKICRKKTKLCVIFFQT